MQEVGIGWERRSDQRVGISGSCTIERGRRGCEGEGSEGVGRCGGR